MLNFQLNMRYQQFKQIINVLKFVYKIKHIVMNFLNVNAMIIVYQDKIVNFK